jgi:RimJ/RimL family protein N-acetyltransferase
MAHPYWPLFDLVVRTPRLEIRLPTDADLFRLIELTDQGVHDPTTMPFSIPWTDTPVPRRHRESLQWWWSARANWRPNDWRFTGAVFVGDDIVGVQELWATRFSQLRSVITGSWLGRAHQGQGLGKEMRAAILHLAFDGLGAQEAHSGAFADNAASLATSRALGYVDNGSAWELQRDRAGRMINLRLDREGWGASRRHDIVIEGLDVCVEMFGIEPPLSTERDS